MWNSVCTLINKKPLEDERGNFYEEEEFKEVFCNEKGIRQSEHYSAMALGIKPTLMLEVMKCDYEGQEGVEFGGTKYRIIRTYPAKKEKLELICESNHLKNG